MHRFRFGAPRSLPVGNERIASAPLLGDLVASREACWFSWSEQTRSLRRLLDYRFEWVFAGHGGSQHLPPDEMHGRLTALLNRMA
jgi:hypothetical protein